MVGLDINRTVWDTCGHVGITPGLPDIIWEIFETRACPVEDYVCLARVFPNRTLQHRFRTNAQNAARGICHLHFRCGWGEFRWVKWIKATQIIRCCNSRQWPQSQTQDRVFRSVDLPLNCVGIFRFLFICSVIEFDVCVGLYCWNYVEVGPMWSFMYVLCASLI